VPIPHPSRVNFLDDLSVAQLYFLNLYSVFLTLIPLIVLVNLRNLKRLMMIFAAIVLLVLGLGGITPLPSIIFGSQWEWLTYERFSVWATILALPLAGEFFLSRKHKILDYVGVVVVIGLIYSTSIWILHPANYFITPPQMDLSPVIKSFAENEACRQRFLALGFGYQLPDLSTYTNANTLDGLWHTAREDSLLRGSGIGALSDALYWNNGRETLEAFLRRNVPTPANCIFVNENLETSSDYIEIIEKYGWKRLNLLSDGVSLWTKGTDLANDNREFLNNLNGDSLSAIFWGTIPLFSLSMFLLTRVYRFAKHYLLD
jgi:hypothetical protein